MKRKGTYTTAFIGITKSGELFIARQHKGTSLVDCAIWRQENREEIHRLYGDTMTVTLKVYE